MPAGLDPNDPYVREMLLRAIGMDAASANPISAQGTFAPEITDMAYDLPSMLGGVQVSKKPQTNLNFAQDLIGSGGLGSNMLSLITGPQATNNDAWKPIRTGTGSPMQFKGAANIDAYVDTGGDDWQTYLATRIKAGDTPAMAMTKLKKLVQGTDETGGVSPASPEFLASLPSSADFNEVPGGQAPDPKTDRGFATLYNLKDMQGFADSLFQGVANDRALQGTGWKDPKTGQWYSGYEDKPTEQMQAADKLGLAYPTQSYGDPDYVHAFQQQMLGSDDTADQANMANRQGFAKAASDAANQARLTAQDQNRELYDAWNAALPPNPEKPLVGTPYEFRGFDQLQQSPPTANPLGLSPDEMANLDAQGYVSTQRQPKTMADFTPAGIDPTATKTHSWRPQVIVGPDGQITLATNANRSQAFVPTGSQTKMDNLSGSIRLGEKSNYREMDRNDLATSTKRQQKAAATATDAQQAYYRSKFLTDDEMNRAKVAASMRYLAYQGRTPLNDQLASRSQTLRNLLG